ncbi:MAG: hypothetical protein ACOC2N_01000 [Spirochaetota bacterium]
MKRLLYLLVFLVILGGVVFFFGWIQIQIPADGYGVIFTRTHGWEAEVVHPGTFAWRWQRLIPTNLTLHVFEPGLHRTQVRLEGSLPSARGIDAILEESGGFDYSVRMTGQTRIRPERLPELARERELRPGDVEEFHDSLDDQIHEIATQAVLSLIESQPERISPGSAYTEITERVRGRLADELDYLEVVALTIEEITLPDMEFYLTARDLAADVLEARAQALARAAEELAETEVQSDRGLSLLERYGEILDRYPVLLEYFRGGKEIEGDPLDLESIIPETDGRAGQ